MKPIIDVSKHNGLLDWEAIQPQIEGAILRIGYRGYSSAGKIVEDKTFEYNESECYRLGIPREYYYFPQDLSYSECVESAIWLMYRLRIYKDLPITIWLDSELAHHGDGRADNLSRKERTERLLDIKNIINRLFPTWTIGIYASNSWIKDHLIYEDILSAGVPLWVARYNNSKGPSYPYRYWQYKNNGSLKGSGCAFDFSVRNGEKIESTN